VGDSGAINRSIGTGPVDDIQWIESMGRLIVGTDDRELQAKTSSLEEPLTPTNFSLRDVSSQGSAPIQAVKLDKRLLFVQKAGVQVMETGYNGQTLDYETGNRSQLVPEIGEPGLSRLAVQRQPDTRVHCVRGATDGTVGLLVSDPAENVAAWVDIESSGGVNGIIEEVVVLPSPGEDAVYYAVKREINGSTVRYLERWSQEWDGRGDGRGARGFFNIESGSSGSPNCITSITVDGVEILPATVCHQGTEEETAAWLESVVRNAIAADAATVKSLDVSAVAGSVRGITLSFDGTKAYFRTSGDKLVQFDLSTPGDIKSGTDSGKEFDFSGSAAFSSELISNGDTANQTGFDDARGHTWHPDGTKIWFCEVTYGTIYECDVSTAWDPDTITHTIGRRFRTNDSFQGPPGGNAPISMQFNIAPDRNPGTRMYVLENDVYLRQYSLNLAYTVHTANADYYPLSIGGQYDINAASTDPNLGSALGTLVTGKYIFYLDGESGAADAIHSFNMHEKDQSERWVVASFPNNAEVRYNGKILTVGGEDAQPIDIFVSANRRETYIVGNLTQTIYQYSVDAPQCTISVVGAQVEVTCQPGDNGKEVIVTTTGDLKVFPYVFSLSGGYSNIGISGRVARNRMADSHVTSDSSDPTTAVTGGEHLVGASVVLWGNKKDL
ncbi:hypothetical protein LCGC14_2123010, partial [marine sediment metagenome]